MLSAPIRAQTLAPAAQHADALASIEAITPARAHTASRFYSPVCLKVTAEDQAFAQAVADRFAQDAKHLQLEITALHCSPNIEISISSDHAQVLRQFLIGHGTRTDSSSPKLDMSAVQKANIIVWSSPAASETTPEGIHYQSIHIGSYELRDVDLQRG